MHSIDVPIKPQALMREFQELLPPEAIVFTDTGNHICWAIHYLRFDQPNFISAFGMLTRGYATVAAIGGKLAAPDRPVIAIVGNGCFLMNGMEVATAVNYHVPVVWMVQNNAKLGLVHELPKFGLGEKTVSTLFNRVDLAKVAEGLGAQGFSIERPGELSEVLPRAVESRKPTVIDVRIDPNEVPPIETWVVGGSDRPLVKVGLNYFVPNYFHQPPRLIQDFIQIDVTLVTVSPMDKAGYFTFGAANDYISTAARHCQTFIVEVNEHIPRVFGDSLLHISEVDAIVENHVPLWEVMPPEPTPEEGIREDFATLLAANKT